MIACVTAPQDMAMWCYLDLLGNMNNAVAPEMIKSKQRREAFYECKLLYYVHIQCMLYLSIHSFKCNSTKDSTVLDYLWFIYLTVNMLYLLP